MHIIKRKWSDIWQLPSAEFKILVTQSFTIKEILIKLNKTYSAGNYRTLHNRLKLENIDISHIRNTTKTSNSTKSLPLEEVLIANSTYKTFCLKKRLLKLGLLESKCSECQLSTNWNNKPLSLQLDHINGINNDNRLENLRMLCPNCHSQTDTYSGKGTKGNKYNNPIVYICPICSAPKKAKISKMCLDCNKKLRVEKQTDLGDLNKVKEFINDFGFEAAGRKYGLTGAGVKKRLRKAGFNEFNKYPKFPNQFIN